MSRYFLTVAFIFGLLFHLYGIAELPFIAWEAYKYFTKPEAIEIVSATDSEGNDCVIDTSGGATCSISTSGNVVFFISRAVTSDEAVTIGSTSAGSNVYWRVYADGDGQVRVNPSQDDGWPNAKDCPWDEIKQVNVCK